MNNDDKKLGKSEYFELREKRLKLVYRILYAIVAIWIAVFIFIGTEKITAQIAPIYAFVLAASSMLIINIVKYALMEFRCMKVIGNIEESLLKQTEERYDNIWKSFSVILSLNALLMLLHFSYFSFSVKQHCCSSSSYAPYTLRCFLLSHCSKEILRIKQYELLT